jgi:hypothetical protein
VSRAWPHGPSVIWHTILGTLVAHLASHRRSKPHQARHLQEYWQFCSLTVKSGMPAPHRLAWSTPSYCMTSSPLWKLPAVLLQTVAGCPVTSQSETRPQRTPKPQPPPRRSGMERQPRSSARSFWKVLAGCGRLSRATSSRTRTGNTCLTTRGRICMRSWESATTPSCSVRCRSRRYRARGYWWRRGRTRPLSA